VLAGVPRSGGGRRKKLEEAARLWASGEFAAAAEQEKNQAKLHESAAAFGLRIDGPLGPEVHVFHLWPEHDEAWRLFLECRTEWRGSGQREGLCKEGVERVMRALRVRPSRRRERFLQLRVLEGAALREWARQREEADRQREQEAAQRRTGR
jgi:hypothetical protein